MKRKAQPITKAPAFNLCACTPHGASRQRPLWCIKAVPLWCIKAPYPSLLMVAARVRFSPSATASASRASEADLSLEGGQEGGVRGGRGGRAGGAGRKQTA